LWKTSNHVTISADKSGNVISNEERPPVTPDPQSSLIESIRASESERRALKAHILGEIALNVADIKSLNEKLDENVLLARELGIPWTAIGDAVGLTFSAAHRRWDPNARAKHANYRKNKSSS
jgi:hypothetical protein